MQAKGSFIMKNLYKEIRSYILITIGTTMMVASVYFFKIPNGFVTGGVSGIGTVLGKALPSLSSGFWIMALNLILLVVGIIILGRDSGIKTIYSSLLFSVLSYVLEFIVPISGPLTDQTFLELVYAMFLTAAGSAIIFNCGASSGGTDILALIIKKYTRLDVGKSLLLTDFFIALSAFFFFGVEAGLFSMVGLFANAFLIDQIIDNFNSCKYFLVITEKNSEITDYIINELHHSATFTEAKGSYTNKPKVMIHTVCRRFEALRLRQYIKKVDPNAFVVISTTSEILGKGFRGV